MYLIAVYPEFNPPHGWVGRCVDPFPRWSLLLIVVSSRKFHELLLFPSLCRHKGTPSSSVKPARPGEPLQGLPPSRWNFHIQIVLDIERIFQANARGGRQATHLSASKRLRKINRVTSRNRTCYSPLEGKRPLRSLVLSVKIPAIFPTWIWAPGGQVPSPFFLGVLVPRAKIHIRVSRILVSAGCKRLVQVVIHSRRRHNAGMRNGEGRTSE